MRFFEDVKRDFKNFWNWMPNEIKVYNNEQEGIFAYEIDNPPNPYVPEKVKFFQDSKKGIFKFHSKKRVNQDKKQLLFELEKLKNTD